MAKLRPRFWEKHALDELTSDEWEALCDGCGKCCLLKLEDFDTAEVAFTNIACRLLDDETCRCSQYKIRKQLVPSCVVISPDSIATAAYWMPKTCAYRRLYEGDALPKWHPLVTGNRNSTQEAGMSMVNRTVPEFDVDEDDYEDYIIEGF